MDPQSYSNVIEFDRGYELPHSTTSPHNVPRKVVICQGLISKRSQSCM